VVSAIEGAKSGSQKSADEGQEEIAPVKPRLIAIYLLIVFVPLGVLAWLGFELAREEEDRVQLKIQSLLTSQLAARNESFAGVIDELERELLKATEIPPLALRQFLKGAPVLPVQQAQIIQSGSSSRRRELLDDASIANLRARVRSGRFIRQMFVLKSDGAMLFPVLDGSETEGERSFFDRTRSVWDSGIVFGREFDNRSTGSQRGPSQKLQQQQSPAFKIEGPHGWQPWFWGNGVNFIFWRKEPGGRVIGIELDRMAFISKILAALPDTDSERAGIAGRIVLRDAQNNPLYQWGGYEPDADSQPAARLPVVAPLSMWTLNYFAPPGFTSPGPTTSTWLNAGTALTAGGILMVLLATYFYRENTRAIRDATQRVSFVNQVSHELKTPLTNIRMYAELLQNECENVGETTDSSREGLNIIVSESQRLSRMISNVLTFAQRQRGRLNLSARELVPDDIVRATLDHFRPALAAKSVKIEFVEGAGEMMRVDADFLEQILGNLFGNVEKYGAAGEYLRVVSSQQGDCLTIEVSDLGPGIPANQREAVFEPFARLSNRLSDGVTGTGIGLTIARELARHHGGDLRILPTELGAGFRLTIFSPPSAPSRDRDPSSDGGGSDA
jgi:signal transduction histidine kinase